METKGKTLQFLMGINLLELISHVYCLSYLLRFLSMRSMMFWLTWALMLLPSHWRRGSGRAC